MKCSRAETFAAGTGGGGVGVVDFETGIFEAGFVVQLAAGDVEGAFGVHHHADATAFDKDVTISGGVLQIHFVLQAAAATASDGHAQHALGSALALEQSGDFFGSGVGELHEAFVAGAIVHFGRGFSFAFACEHGQEVYDKEARE